MLGQVFRLNSFGWVDIDSVHYQILELRSHNFKLCNFSDTLFLAIFIEKWDYTGDISE